MNNENLIRIDQFCLHHGIEVKFITALHEYGIIEIITVEEQHYFLQEQLADVEKIIRLYYELEINLEGIDTILILLKQIESLQMQLRDSQNKIKFFEKM